MPPHSSPRHGRVRTVLLGIAALALPVACSSGPAPLERLVSTTDRHAYESHLGAADGDARTAWLAWRSEETGTPVATLAAADAALPEDRNPFDRRDPWAAQRGAMLYQAHCLECHGSAADGRGPDGSTLLGAKDFHNSHIRAAVGMSSSYVTGWYETVRDGTTGDETLPGGEPAVMPAFRDLLSREQMWLTVTYLTTEDGLDVGSTE